MSTTPDLITPRDPATTGVFADAAGYLSAVEARDPATQQSASWSGGTSKPNAQRYRCIVADPPWRYQSRLRASGGSGHYGDPGVKLVSVPFDEYSTMTVDEICALPVPALAEDDAHLYLWTTQTFLRETYRVLDAWGFKQGAILVWAKPPKGVVGTYVCSVEFCIFARRGNLAHKRRQLGTCYQWPRSGHSAKPEAFQDMVESVSPGPYLELFARRQRLGWDTWGNEAFCHVSMDGFEECVSGLPNGEAVATEGRKDNAAGERQPTEDAR